MDPETYEGFRVPAEGEGADSRSIKEIPVVELMNAGSQILEQQFSLPEEDFGREVARVFGIKRYGRNVQQRMEKALARL